MSKKKVEFIVKYNPKLVNKIGNLMSKLDLGVVGIEMPHYTKIGWNTTTKVNKKYYKLMEKQIRTFYEEQGCTVMEITHGDYED
jgi:hypothetical protein